MVSTKENFKIEQLKKLSISNLSLLILDSKNDYLIRKCSEVELKKRIKHLGWEYQDLLHSDEKVISLRGMDINEYLINSNPNMQRLIEVYFTYCFETWDDNLLFSERHLCNNMNFCAIFFDKICDKEIINLNNRIKNSSNEEDKQLLNLFKLALEKRKDDIEKIKKQHYCGTEILEYNEALQFLDRGFLLEFGTNVSDEEKYKILRSKLLTAWFLTLESMNDGILDADLFQNIYGLKKVLEDSLKLNTQKNILFNQVKKGFEVDYSSESMQKNLEKVKKYISSDKTLYL